MSQNKSSIDIGNNSGSVLLGYVERIENVQEDIDNYKEDQKCVYQEAKANGFDVKILRTVVKRRKMDREALAEQDSLLEVYEDAISQLKGMME